MKGLGLLPCAALTIALVLGGTAVAQNVGDNSVYFVTYYSNKVPGDFRDQTVRIINDGDTGASLWATFYVYDDSEEMQTCCSCEVTPDGLLSESVRYNLAGNPLTGIQPSRGAIKVISSSVQAGAPRYTNTPTTGLRGFATHLQSVENQTPYGPAPYYQTETELQPANLGATDESWQEEICFFVHILGGGHQGVCSCTPEDLDF